jgi:hypothetical protein
MWPEHWIEGIENVQLELRRWKGAVGQGWAYSVSHSQLLVRVYREEAGGTRSPTSLWLYLKDCYRVSFQDLWRGADIQIEQRPGKYGPEFIVTDGDRLFVHCGVRPFAAESLEFLSFERPAI